MFNRYIALILLLNCTFFHLEARPLRSKQDRYQNMIQKEEAIGKKGFPALQQDLGGRYTVHPEINHYVTDIMNKLLPHTKHQNFDFQIEVVNSSMPNAITLPSGKIVITRGLLLLLKNEAELAAILSHEMHHAVAHHGIRQSNREKGASFVLGGLSIFDGGLLTGTVGKLVNAGVQSSISRQDEIESDLYGMAIMHKAGYNTDGMASVQKMFLEMEKGKKTFMKGLFDSHPPSKERLKKILSQQRRFPKKHTFLGKERFQENIGPLFTSKPAYENYEKAKKAFATKHYQEAEKHVKEAISKEPNEAIFYCLLGKIAYQQKRYSLAIEAFSRGIELNPYYYDLFLSRAKTYGKLGKKDEEARDLEKVKALFRT